MKKNQLQILTLMLFMTFCTSRAFAQFGIRAGVNFTNVSVKEGDDLDDENTKIKPGFHVGATYDIGVTDMFAVQPGLLFSTKGAKYKYDDGNGEYAVTPYYLELPINFLYKPVLGDGNLLLGGGPYVAYGVGGKWKDKYEDESATGKLVFINDYENEPEDDDVEVYGRKLDAGINFLAGYEFSNRFSVQFNAQLGLMNTVPKFDGEKPDGAVKNNGFGISIGYKF